MTPLSDWIRHKLQTYTDRRATFAQFMEWALYHPSLGYYRRQTPKVGKKGDFYTSAHVHPVFGETLAATLCRLGQSFAGQKWCLIECGAGDGKLAQHILRAIRNEPINDTLAAYFMVETSPYQRDLAQTRLKHESRVMWVDSLDRIPVDKPIIAISNEFLDAMPVHRLRYTEGEWAEIYVTWDERESSFIEMTGPCSSPEIKQYIREEAPPEREGQTVEVNCAARTWLEQLSAMMGQGYVMTIDYGYTKDELWSTKRVNGTLMCYSRHRAHTNPYIGVGEQDMTTHVNFSSLQRWGNQFGLRALQFTTQGKFLIQEGILEKLQEHRERDPFSEVARRNRAIRQLITPGGMGDTFKVLLQEKGVTES